MPTTVEFWEIDGVSLSEEGWNVTTLGGRYNVPPLRGDNAQYAYVEGQDFRPKTPDSRSLVLNMWTTGVEPYSGVPGQDQMRKWNDNWHFLCQLFWTPRRQVTITRRWLRTDTVTGVPEIQISTAKAQYVSGLEPTMTGRFRATFNVELRLSDPFFYGAEITSPDVPSAGQQVQVFNPGDYQAASRHMFIELVGPLLNPMLTNLTPLPNVSVEYNGNIPAGQVITLDVRQFTATAAVNEVSIPENPVTKNRVGFVHHMGSRSWFGLERGQNTLRMLQFSARGRQNTNPPSGGLARVRFRPPYL